MRVEVYPNNALGNEREVIELVIIGAVELASPSNAPLATFAQEMLIFDLPFLFRSREHMYAVLDGPVGQRFIEPLHGRGLQLLGYFEAGLRHLMTVEKPIERFQDLAGLKIRTMENPLHLRAFHALWSEPPAHGIRRAVHCARTGRDRRSRGREIELPLQTVFTRSPRTGPKSAGCIWSHRWS